MGYLEHDGADMVAHRSKHKVLDEGGVPLPQVRVCLCACVGMLIVEKPLMSKFNVVCCKCALLCAWQRNTLLTIHTHADTHICVYITSPANMLAGPPAALMAACKLTQAC
eukprot:1157834-Pelagomonas_calceolata.AAC.17